MDISESENGTDCALIGSTLTHRVHVSLEEWG